MIICVDGDRPGMQVVDVNWGAKGKAAGTPHDKCEHGSNCFSSVPFLKPHLSGEHGQELLFFFVFQLCSSEITPRFMIAVESYMCGT